MKDIGLNIRDFRRLLEEHAKLHRLVREDAALFRRMEANFRKHGKKGHAEDVAHIAEQHEKLLAEIQIGAAA